MLKQLRPQRLRDADELVPRIGKLRHRRRLVLVDPQIIGKSVSIMIGHLVAVQVDLEAKTVPSFRAVDAARGRAALLHITGILNTFALLRPVLTLRVLIRTQRVRRGERERRERREGPRHRFVFGSLRRRPRCTPLLSYYFVGSSHKELCSLPAAKNRM